MATNTDLTPLEFSSAKQKITDLFKNSDDFKDYDFTGSRLNVLLDVLAYATTYEGSYANAAVFESWNNYARTREAVVQHAQNNGYVPSSRRSATINGNLVMKYIGNAAQYPTVVNIPRGFKIYGQSGNKTYPFIVTTTTELYGSVNTFSGSIPLAQGKLLQNTYRWAKNGRIFIKDPTIDRRFVTVTVNGSSWTLAENAARVDATAPVFYMRETVEGWTEVYFGVGEFTVSEDELDLSQYIGGLKPLVGDDILVEFLSTVGEEANFITSFKVVDTVNDFSVFDFTIEENDYSSGGAEREDIERIRVLSPKMYEAQGRCVTATDYETFVRKEFGGIISSIKCWTQPGKTGYAYIAIKPTDGLELSPSQITAIDTYLKKYNVVAVTPKIVRPIYIFMNHSIEVDFDPNLLDISEQQLRQNIIDSIEKYYVENITTFNSSFHNSKMMTAVDATHQSILGTACDIDIVKEFAVEVFWDLSGGTYMGDTIPTRGLITYPFTWNEINDANEIINTAELVVDSTDSGLLVLGPFPHQSAAYCGILYNDIDFNSKVATSADKWYVVGSVTYSTGRFSLTDFDELPSYRFTQESIDEDSIRFKAIIGESDIYPANGEIIAFEPTVRAEYINITLVPIATTYDPT